MQRIICNGRYVLTRVLARRGVAQVWLGHDLWLDEPVVLKSAAARRAEQLRAEFRILSRLHHPNLVEVRDLVLERDELILVLDHAPGPDFVGWASADPRPERVALAAAAVVRGLQYLHAAGAVHRDIKPDNIRVGPGTIGSLPAARILDFGLASQQAAGETAGTRGYIPPEVLAGEPARPASDLYSLGVVILQAVLQTPLAASRAPDDASLLLERWPAARLLAETLADLLQAEPEQRPDAAELLATLGTVAGRPVSISADELAADYFPRPPLVGRGDCLVAFDRMAQQARAGRTSRLQLLGPGKSRLAHEAQSVARLAGLRVFAASSASALLRLAGLEHGGEDPQRLAVQLLDRLLARADAEPVMICFDGIDETAHDVVVSAVAEQLTRHAPRQGCWVVWTGQLPLAAGDREQAGTSSAELRQGWERMELSPLDSHQVHKLVRGMLHHLDAVPWLDQVHPASSGDPRLVVELVRAQITAGLPDELVAQPELSQLVDQLARRRIDQLTDAERRLLAMVSLAPRPVPPTVLVRVAPGALPWLGALLGRGLVVTSAEGVAVESEALRAVASAWLASAIHGAPQDLARLHRQYADAWAAEDALDPATIGHHLLRAGDHEGGTRRLLEAPLIADNDLLLALEALPSRSSLRRPVLERLSHAARARGDLDRALALAGQLAEQDRGRATLLRAELLLDAGQPARAIEAADELLSGREDEHDASEDAGDDASEETAGVLASELHGAAHAVRARARILLGAFSEAAAEAQAGLRIEGLPPARRVQLQNALGLGLDYGGESEPALAVLERAARSARQLPDSALLARVLNSQGIVLSRLGRLEEACACYRECVERFSDLGDLRLAATCTLNLGTLAHRRMALSEALEHYRHAAALSARGALDSTSAWAAANEANLLLLFGEHQQAEARLQQALSWAQGEGSRALVGHVLIYRAEALRAEGQLEEAAELVERARTRFDPSDRPGHDAADLTACEILLQRGECEPAGQLAQGLLQRMSPADPERWWALLLAARTALSRIPPALEPAVRQLEAALAAGAATRPPAVPGERDWEIHALLAVAHRRLQHHEQANAAAERFRAARDDLRRRVPAASRHRFDGRADLRAAVDLVARSASGEGSAPVRAGLLRVLEINKELNRGLALEQLLPRILEEALELTGAERGFVLLGGDGGRLRLAASRNVDRDPIKRGMGKFSRSIAREAIAHSRPVVVSDATEDERYYRQVSIRGLKLRSVLCVPLRSRGEVLGALYLDNRFQAEVFDPATVALSEAFADQAGIAIDNARLLQQTAAQREQLALAKAEVEALNRRLELQLAEKTQQLSEVSTRLRHQEEELVRRYNAAQLVGRSRAMRRLFVQIDRVKDADLPVFIHGESGTGKELVARAIHYTGPRAAEPFVAVNCGAIPASLLESELFGYQRGAFTGAESDRPGVFEIAGQGTLFLDEVTEMEPAMQVKLLRVLQEGTFRRLGDQQERRSRCRVLSASNKALQPLVAAGRFREDLYYRLNVVELAVPPLRERRDDLPLLVEHFLGGKPAPLTAAALTALLDHDWPGNVRQLENELARAALLADEEITLADLSSELRGTLVAPADEQATAHGLQQTVREYERRVIETALEQAEHNVSLAAQQLQIHRVVLHRKIKALGIGRKSRAQAS